MNRVNRGNRGKAGTSSVTQMVGRVINYRRKLLNISQETLAEKIGIGQQSLSRMEQGKMAPKFERLHIIAEALECHVADLFIDINALKNSYGEYLAHVMQPLSDTDKTFVLEQATSLANFLACKRGQEETMTAREEPENNFSNDLRNSAAVAK